MSKSLSTPIQKPLIPPKPQVTPKPTQIRIKPAIPPKPRRPPLSVPPSNDKPGSVVSDNDSKDGIPERPFKPLYLSMRKDKISEENDLNVNNDKENLLSTDGFYDDVNIENTLITSTCLSPIDCTNTTDSTSPISQYECLDTKMSLPQLSVSCTPETSKPSAPETTSTCTTSLEPIPKPKVRTLSPSPRASPRTSLLISPKADHSPTNNEQKNVKPSSLQSTEIDVEDGTSKSESNNLQEKRKRIASRRLLPTASARVVKMRSPPPPKESTDDHLRPKDTGSSLDSTTTCSEDTPKTAEEQSLYSYAYERVSIPPDTAPQSSPETTISGDLYVDPDTSAVAGFMEELENKKIQGVGEYEIPAEDSVQGFIESLTDTQDNTCTPEDFSVSSDSDDSHDYESPCDSPPPVPPHRNIRSGSYDITSIKDDDSDDSDDYVEPPDAQGFESSEEETEEDEMTEPLYQVYTARTLERDRTLSRKKTTTNQSDNSFDNLTKGTLRNMRMLWCEIPEIVASGILNTIDNNERKRQEAMFEVITSEASYLKSLNILDSHFIQSPELIPGTPQSVLEKAQCHILFSNVQIVLEASRKFLDALRKKSMTDLVISSISDIIKEFASDYFDVYVRYCSNQMHQDREFRKLRKSPRFLEGVERLEKCAIAQSLSLQSFLVLPMQRITRLPLLVDAICHRCEPGSEEFIQTDAALKAIHKVVRDCNEGARKMERMDEMVALQQQIQFIIKPIALVSASRWLLRRGEVLFVTEQHKTALSKKKLKLKPVYMFLFNDLLLITKKKGECRYRVLDYAARNMTRVETSSDAAIQLDYVLSLILLENCNGKTKDFLFSADSQTDKTRWLEAFNPPKAEKEGEKVYGAWDCPQVQVIHNYNPQQPDELALHEGDVINVQRKLMDGWYHGERLCDGVCGWFPANYTENIRNEHVRARNLLQRYRLLAASKHLIGAVQTMKQESKIPKLTLKGIASKRETIS